MQNRRCVDVLYHFPTEPLFLKDLRDNALDELRWRLRVPVIRQFGTAATECFAVVCRCESCEYVSAGLRGVASSTFDTSYQQLVNFFIADETWQEPGMIPDECCSCGAKSPKPVSAFLAKYLPALEKDFQLSLTFRGRRVHQATIHLMNAKGEAVKTTLAALTAEEQPPLSIRSMWRQFIGSHLFADECAIRKIMPGYFVGIRPYADSPWSLHGFNMQLETIVEQFEADGFDVFAPMSEVEDLGLGLSHADLYSNWLGAYASDIAGGTIQPFVLARTSDFVEALIRESGRLGIRAERVGESTELMIRFSTPDLHVELNLARLLMRIVHSGLGFSEGIVEFFGRELSGIRAGAEAIPLIRRALPMLSVSVLDGIKLLMTDGQGKQVSCFDVIRFATTFDLRDREEFLAACGQVAPSYSPKMLTLSPHVAGQTSVVVRRL